MPFFTFWDTETTWAGLVTYLVGEVAAQQPVLTNVQPTPAPLIGIVAQSTATLIGIIVEEDDVHG